MAEREAQLVRQIERLLQDLAAEKFKAREWKMRARDMELERDRAIDALHQAREALSA